MKKQLLLLPFLALLLSCKTAKDVSYLQDIDTNTEALAKVAAAYSIRITSDDMLSIMVSATNPESVAMFNMPVASVESPGNTSMQSTPIMQTYLVDAEGYIIFPVLGKIKAAGLTKDELSASIAKQITTYVKNPIVTIRLMNFKIGVLGEVNSPGYKSISHERVSVLDAIVMAGDLNIYGQRKNVLLIREGANGIETHRFDLTSANIFASPYFYLQQNDVLYVEPNNARKSNSKYSQNAQVNISFIATIVSAISVIVALIIK
ncbi:polysaccharide export protein [Bacteroides sp. 214]|uniref:polysaccharide biosynthesis/export family protein n=1 Tax=Bacteroides sp. 214 TaxID=2302935 RepID=UPI0013D0E2CA|nr:polysaccharide biosynthesis/export family protein [Bacteroides sp. 214]NDW12797.1 polysaccharide export protein [Bacteroides sp. 214]